MWQADETTRLNVRWLCREVAWAGVGGGIVVSFLSIFALRLGASATEVGLLTTGPALAGIICPLPSARIVSRRWGKRIVVLPLALNRLLYAVLVCVPMAPSSMQVPLLVAAVTLASVPGALFTTAFVPLLAKVLPTEIRAHVVGVRSTLSGLTSTLTVLVVGKFLDVLRFPLNFQIAFIVGLITTQMSTALISRITVPALNETPAAAPRSAGAWSRANPEARQERAAFWRFTVGAFVFNLGIFVPSALYPIVQVDKLHASNGWIGAIATAGGLAGVICSSLAARAVTRYGNRMVLVVSGLAYSAMPIGAALAPSVMVYMFVAAAMGGLGAFIGISLFQCLLDAAPVSRQTHYTATYSMVVNGAVAGGPLLGTFLLGLSGLTLAFAVGAALIFLGSLGLLASDPNRRTRPPVRPVRGPAHRPASRHPGKRAPGRAG